MRLYKGFAALDRVPIRPVVTIGNFDGVHLGHRRIIALALEKARARQGEVVVYTFRPHPQIALRPASSPALLTTYDEKLELLGSLGVQVAIEEPFSREFSTVGPQTFFNDVLVRRLNAEAVVVGYDFAFGKEREGHLDTLEALCRANGLELTVVPPLREGGEVVSSSRIRQHFLAGEIEAGNRLLGREFSYSGDVVHGEGRGRKLGFPTANLRLESKLALPYGVYACRASCDGREYPAVTNVGVRPTFQEGGRELPALVECHLIGESAEHAGQPFTIDLYGRRLDVRFVRRIREERRFSGIEALKAQIAADVSSAVDALR
jgi:riboflavin kinase/FMN adenylyltransferase